MSEKVSTIGDLIQDRTNPRKHNPRNLKVIVDSLHDVGFARSIVIDENNTILAGNGVTEAAALAGIENVIEVEADGNTIIAVRRRGLTDEQKQRMKYYDNRSRELAIGTRPDNGVGFKKPNSYYVGKQGRKDRASDTKAD